MPHGLVDTGITYKDGPSLTSAPNTHANVDNTKYTKLVSSCAYNCAAILTVDGELVTWAGNQNAGYECGTGISFGSTGPKGVPKIVPFPASETGKIVYAKMVGQVIYVRFDNGNLYSCGYGIRGVTANGTSSNLGHMNLCATNVAFVTASQTSGNAGAGYEHVFIVKNDGTVWAAGNNAAGALGLGDTTNRYSFTQVTSIAANTVAQTAEHGYSIWCLNNYIHSTTVIQKTDGTIWMAGWNEQYTNAWGSDMVPASYYPYGTWGIGPYVTTFTDMTSKWGGAGGGAVLNVFMATGYYVTFHYQLQTIQMLRSTNTASNATIYSCGYNANGECGDGTSTTPRTAVYSKVLGSGAAGQLRCTGGHMSTYYLRNGTLYTYGYNGYGQLGNGNGTSTGVVQTSATSPSGNAWDKILFGTFDSHTYGYTGTAFVRDVAGNVYSVGYNGHGQRAKGDTGDTNLAWTLCPQLKGALEIVGNGTGTGNWYMAVLPNEEGLPQKRGGRLVAWGHGGWYQIEHVMANTNFTLPVEFQSLYRI